MATCLKYVAFKSRRLRVIAPVFLRGVFSIVKTISITINFCWKGLWHCQVAAFQETWQESITRMHSHYDLLEPYVTFRKVLFQVLNRLDYLPQHLLEFSTIARKVYSSFPVLLCQWVYVAMISSYIHWCFTKSWDVLWSCQAGRPNHAENLIHELKLLSKSNSGAFIAANGKMSTNLRPIWCRFYQLQE